MFVTYLTSKFLYNRYMEYLNRWRVMVDDRLEEVIDSVDQSKLQEEIQHVVLAGGKRVRPIMTLIVCEALGGEPEDAIDYAASVELVHNASLVVDDVIDDSDLRRGTPSAWAEYGHVSAFIASDGIMGEAFQLLSDDVRAMQSVAESSVKLGQGEATELMSMPSNQEEYLLLIKRKTAALFRSATELGAIAAGADEYTIESFGRYGEQVGLAFQIRDDVLDATADTETLGKPANHDADMERPSVVEVTELSVDEANQLAEEQLEGAFEALNAVEAENENSMEYLRAIAEFVVDREH